MELPSDNPISPEVIRHREQTGIIVFLATAIVFGIWSYVSQSFSYGWAFIMGVVMLALSRFATKGLKIPKTFAGWIGQIVLHAIVVMLLTLVITGGIFFFGCLFGVIKVF
jgi:hypothetical protein